MLGLDTTHIVLLVICLAVALGFEFVNGFHDTANAVATVIYTRSLKPWVAVIWSGLCNFAGVFVGGIAVAMSIIKLLPVEILVAGGTGKGLAMVLSLLIAAIIWNVGTWYFGLPSSSSHTLIGAILGVGLANSIASGHGFGHGVNWSKAGEVGMSLLLSPMFGFTVAAGLLLLSRRLLPDPRIHEPVSGESPPPGWIRALLVGTCTGVSFAHGSNDGQKGVGLIMLILISTMPAQFAVNRHLGGAALDKTRAALVDVEQLMGGEDPARVAPKAEIETVRKALEGRKSLAEIPDKERFQLRKDIMVLDGKLSAIEKAHHFSVAELARWKKDRASLRAAIDYAPTWVLVAVALALGVGTMVGWKRIVITVGEKIGKTHLSYSQGAAAELVAMSTIGLSSWFGLPVSTTHMLSSGIAGTMVARRSGLQGRTVGSIGLAWILTLPVTIVLAGVLFLVLNKLF